ncbi:MAG: thrombospondin type 3 repeat-containing protein, partial [Flavobacteriaceae bacterium]
ADNDTDTIGDDCDLDDDNDGILDSTESPCATAQPIQLNNFSSIPEVTLSGNGINVTVSHNGQGVANGTTTGNLTMGNGGTTSNISEVTFTFDQEVRIEIGSKSGSGGAWFDSSDGWKILDSGNQFVVSDPDDDITANSGEAFNNEIEFTSSSTGNNFDDDWTITTVRFTKSLTIQYQNPSQSNSGTINIGIICVAPDHDGDGIVDAYDLDSDNDGCPDALEGASSTFDFDDLNEDGSVDTSSHAVDTTSSSSTYGSPGSTNNAIGTSQDNSQQATECDSCNSSSTLFTDNDNDGIGDECDLDDDNDGILDTVECPQPTSKSDYTRLSADWFGFSADELDVSAPATDISSHFSLPAGSIIVEINDIDVQSNGTTFKMDDQDLAEFKISGSHPVFLFVRHGPGLDDYDGIEGLHPNDFIFNGGTLDPVFTYSHQGVQHRITNTDENYQNGTTDNFTWISNRFKNYVKGVTGDAGTGFHVYLRPACDTDSDGIPDHLDTDSDNDGCPDALEGASSTFDYDDLNTDGSVDTSSNAVDTTTSSSTYGSPGSTNNAIGSSQDNSQQAAECDSCNSSSTLFTDNDNDTIGDECDLDDDNDGILDSEECTTGTFIAIDPTDFGVTGTSQTNGINGTQDVSSKFGLPTGSVIVEVIGGNTNNAGTGWGVGNFDQNRTRFKVTGTTPVKIRTTHGPALTDYRDGFIALDHAKYTFDSTLESGYASAVNGDYHYVEGDGSGDGDQSMQWTSDHFATEVEFYTSRDHASVNSGVGFRLAVGCQDTDNDDTPDHLDLDSDADGCSDANEAYASNTADGGDNGIYGNGAPTVNSHGLVTAAGVNTDGDAYTTTPAQTTGSLNTFQEGMNVTISTAPTDQTGCVGDTITFSAVASATVVSGNSPEATASTNVSYQWQVSTDGTTFTDISSESGTVASGT